MKKIVCKPAPELTIECGEDVILLRFDLYSVANLQELSEGGLNELMQKSFPEIAASIVYAAGKNNNENFTHDKARAIVAYMGVEDIREIIDTYSESMGIVKNGVEEEYQKKLMAQFLMNMK